MGLKIPSNKIHKGFTLVELLVVIAVSSLLLSILVVQINHPQKINQAKDIKRMADLSSLERVINEYRMNTGFYPDSVGVIRKSNTLPSGNDELTSSSSGWIDEDLAKYTSRLPVDPVNDDSYYYYYVHSNSGYELNAKLKYLTNEMQNDGGNDSEMYEVGSNLNLIAP